MKSSLQNKFNQIQTYCKNWKLTINFQKCETILFRSTIHKGNKDLRKNWKNFNIRGLNDEFIELRTTVRYLGIMLDKFLYFNDHVKYQLAKAQAAFMMWKKLFYSKKINNDVKVICYQAFIRPIITYSCQIWWNISPSTMEKIRLFERKCLRACTNTYRSEQSDYLHYTSNKKLLNIANINRIDMFIVKLIRNHFSRLHFSNNSEIWGCMYPNDAYYERALISGYIPPETFIYLDSRGYIVNSENAPLFYHVYRRATNKKTLFNPLNISDTQLRYCRNISNKDLKELENINKNKYFWLS